MAIPRPARTNSRVGRAVIAVLGGFLAMVIWPAIAFAHPLGNFTINHYAGIRVTTSAISVDVVIDQAEIPTVSERQRIDTNGDGQVSSSEIEQERQVACGRLSGSLNLSLNGQPQALTVVAAGLTFPPGAAGLPTMRLVCEYVAALAGPLANGSVVQFADTSNAERIGWREIVVSGDGVTIGAWPAGATSVSDRLTHYPQNLLTVPLSMAEATFRTTPGGPSSGSPCIPDAFPLSPAPTPGSRGLDCGASPGGPGAPAPGAVPGGVGSDISKLLSTTDLTFPVLLLSLLTAMALGAAHALTPGHGKTVMAAYLVGTRGTARHAVALGLTVTLSHTIGVFALAGVILALRIVTPESYNHALGIVAGVMVIGIGGWFFVRQGIPLLRTRLLGANESAQRPSHVGGTHEHIHGHGHEHRHHSEEPHHHHPPVVRTADGTATPPGLHSHGGLQHSHVPASADIPLTWRSLFALGLFGGLVPSVNALIILLATLATGRAFYGLVLVVAFGAGMAIVLSGVGLGLVYASRWMEGNARVPWLGRVLVWAPAVTSLTILVVGLYLTGQAIVGSPTL